MQLDPVVANYLHAAGPELADAAGKSPFLSREGDGFTVVPPILLASAALLGMFKAQLSEESEHLDELTHVRLKGEAVQFCGVRCIFSSRAGCLASCSVLQEKKRLVDLISLGLHQLQQRQRLSGSALDALCTFIQQTLLTFHNKSRDGVTGEFFVSILRPGERFLVVCILSCQPPSQHRPVAAALSDCLEHIGKLPLVSIAQLAAFVFVLVGHSFQDLFDFCPETFQVLLCCAGPNCACLLSPFSFTPAFHCIALLQELEMSTVATADVQDGHLQLTGVGMVQLLPSGVLEAHQDSSVEGIVGACAEYVARSIVGASAEPSALEIAEAIQKHAFLVSSVSVFKVLHLILKNDVCAQPRVELSVRVASHIFESVPAAAPICLQAGMLLAVKLHLENARDEIEEKLHSWFENHDRIQAEVRSNVTGSRYFGARLSYPFIYLG